MAKAIWNGKIIAESEDFVLMVDAYYFPIQSIQCEYLIPSSAKTKCFCKGDALYYHIQVNGEKIENAAWYYPDPYPMAENVRDKIAFLEGVKIVF